MTTSLHVPCFAVLFGSFLLAQPQENRPTVRILSTPLPSPQQVANLESRLQANPNDLESRLGLLRVYLDTAPIPPNDDPVRRSARLEHILYLIDHHPEAQAGGMPLSYVARSNGPYANEGDHWAARNRWLAAIDAHRGDTRVLVNAVRFLAVEDKNDAESVLQRAVAAYPENREIAANLGFLYAMEILGLNSLSFGARPPGSEPDLASHAAVELERTSNPFVLAAAGTAIPNLAVASSGGGAVDPKLFEFASNLSTRARRLAPGDPDIQGPMPLIRYFAAARDLQAQGPLGAASLPATQQYPAAPSRIRVGGNVQSELLVRKAQPRYPEEARSAGITGDVRFNAVIARDGTIGSLQVISGHPLLIPAALEAVKSWVYKPTVLNGVPVEVITVIAVSFPGN